jgi:hypothetical protein
LQFDWLGVSMANQYKVSPAALTSTVPLLVLIVLIATEVAAAAGLDVDPPVGAPLLPQAARTTAAAAIPGTTHHRLGIALSPSYDLERRHSIAGPHPAEG